MKKEYGLYYKRIRLLIVNADNVKVIDNEIVPQDIEIVESDLEKLRNKAIYTDIKEFLGLKFGIDFREIKEGNVLKVEFCDDFGRLPIYFKGPLKKRPRF